MIRLSQVRQHYSIPTKFQIWIAINDKPLYCALEGTKEEMNTPEALAQAERSCTYHWEREEIENKALDAAQAKFPKKEIVLDGHEILVYSKNGNVFKTLLIEY